MVHVLEVILILVRLERSGRFGGIILELGYHNLLFGDRVFITDAQRRLKK